MAIIAAIFAVIHRSNDLVVDVYGDCPSAV